MHGFYSVEYACRRTGGEDGAEAVAEKLFGDDGLGGGGSMGIDPKPGHATGRRRGTSEAFLDAEKLIVFRIPLRPARCSGFDLAGACRDGKVCQKIILCLSGPV